MQFHRGDTPRPAAAGHPSQEGNEYRGNTPCHNTPPPRGYSSQEERGAPHYSPPTEGWRGAPGWVVTGGGGFPLSTHQSLLTQHQRLV